MAEKRQDAQAPTVDRPRQDLDHTVIPIVNPLLSQSLLHIPAKNGNTTPDNSKARRVPCYTNVCGRW